MRLVNRNLFQLKHTPQHNEQRTHAQLPMYSVAPKNSFFLRYSSCVSFTRLVQTSRQIQKQNPIRFLCARLWTGRRRAYDSPPNECLLVFQSSFALTFVSCIVLRFLLRKGQVSMCFCVCVCARRKGCAWRRGRETVCSNKKLIRLLIGGRERIAWQREKKKRKWTNVLE